MILFGDDVSLTSDNPKYDADAIQRALNGLKLVYTNGDKKGDAQTTNIYETEFLKRGYRFVQGIWLAPLSIDSICGQLQYSKVRCEDLGTYKLLLGDLVTELSIHPKRVYDKIRDEILQTTKEIQPWSNTIEVRTLVHDFKTIVRMSFFDYNLISNEMLNVIANAAGLIGRSLPEGEIEEPKLFQVTDTESDKRRETLSDTLKRSAEFIKNKQGEKLSERISKIEKAIRGEIKTNYRPLRITDYSVRPEAFFSCAKKRIEEREFNKKILAELKTFQQNFAELHTLRTSGAETVIELLNPPVTYFEGTYQQQSRTVDMAGIGALNPAQDVMLGTPGFQPFPERIFPTPDGNVIVKLLSDNEQTWNVPRLMDSMSRRLDTRNFSNWGPLSIVTPTGTETKLAYKVNTSQHLGLVVGKQFQCIMIVRVNILHNVEHAGFTYISKTQDHATGNIVNSHRMKWNMASEGSTMYFAMPMIIPTDTITVPTDYDALNAIIETSFEQIVVTLPHLLYREGAKGQLSLSYQSCMTEIVLHGARPIPEISSIDPVIPSKDFNTSITGTKTVKHNNTVKFGSIKLSQNGIVRFIKVSGNMTTEQATGTGYYMCLQFKKSASVKTECKVITKGTSIGCMTSGLNLDKGTYDVVVKNNTGQDVTFTPNSLQFAITTTVEPVFTLSTGTGNGDPSDDEEVFQTESQIKERTEADKLTDLMDGMLNIRTNKGKIMMAIGNHVSQISDLFNRAGCELKWEVTKQNPQAALLKVSVSVFAKKRGGQWVRLLWTMGATKQKCKEYLAMRLLNALTTSRVVTFESQTTYGNWDAAQPERMMEVRHGINHTDYQLDQEVLLEVGTINLTNSNIGKLATLSIKLSDYLDDTILKKHPVIKRLADHERLSGNAKLLFRPAKTISSKVIMSVVCGTVTNPHYYQQRDPKYFNLDEKFEFQPAWEHLTDSVKLEDYQIDITYRIDAGVVGDEGAYFDIALILSDNNNKYVERGPLRPLIPTSIDGFTSTMSETYMKIESGQRVQERDIMELMKWIGENRDDSPEGFADANPYELITMEQSFSRPIDEVAEEIKDFFVDVGDRDKTFIKTVYNIDIDGFLAGEECYDVRTESADVDTGSIPMEADSNEDPMVNQAPADPKIVTEEIQQIPEQTAPVQISNFNSAVWPAQCRDYRHISTFHWNLGTHGVATIDLDRGLADFYTQKFMSDYVLMHGHPSVKMTFTAAPTVRAIVKGFCAKHMTDAHLSDEEIVQANMRINKTIDINVTGDCIEMQPLFVARNGSIYRPTMDRGRSHGQIVLYCTSTLPSSLADRTVRVQVEARWDDVKLQRHVVREPQYNSPTFKGHMPRN